MPAAPLYDALVVGGGPAGLTAALQLARFNRRVLCFDSGEGRSTYHQVNHNYLGFPGGIPSRTFRDLARAQVTAYPVAFIDEAVVAAGSTDGCFAVSTADGTSFAGRTIVIATGVRDRFPAFPGWESYVGRSIFWCIVCDGYSTRGKRIVVTGNDTDAGVTALQFLEFTRDITVLTNARFCGLSDAVCAALDRNGIPLVVDEIVGVVGNGGLLGGITLGGGATIELDYLFSLQGCTPNSRLARDLGVACNVEGFILADMEQHTNVPGVFAAGDVTRDLAHQVATAVHEGNTAATTANYYLYRPEQQHETYRVAD